MRLAAALLSLGLLATCGQTLVISCVKLADPTPEIADALKAQARRNSKDRDWVTGLDTYYRLQDACPDMPGMPALNAEL
jgi:hypothetical protein